MRASLGQNRSKGQKANIAFVLQSENKDFVGFCSASRYAGRSLLGEEN